VDPFIALPRMDDDEDGKGGKGKKKGRRKGEKNIKIHYEDDYDEKKLIKNEQEGND